MYWFFGFVTTFTIGGVTGVMMAVPAIDFQVHNSLFLVAHFHNMIIGGVVFGYFAGITYWFPKIFGFKLNERLGKYAAWCWIIGFLVAFIPLYILGIMGATRRLDHYDPSMGWQGLFIVAGFGAMIIGLGVALQILQFVVSIKDRKKNIDTTGDPWNGRTLEWSTRSPAPFYNFAVIPTVTTRDAFWEIKESGKAQQKPKYADIHMPKNTGVGIYISGLAFTFGFSVIWHVYWAAAISVVAIIAVIINRSLTEETEYKITAKELENLILLEQSHEPDNT